MNDFFRKTGNPKDLGSKEVVGPEQEYQQMLKIFRKISPAKVSEENRTKLIIEANKIMNDGDLEKACIIYKALNYYSGLVRVAKAYNQQGKILEAYACFMYAGAEKESEMLGQKIAEQISIMLQKDDA